MSVSQEAKELICDTNAWYKFAFGEWDPAALKASGYRLCAIPTNVMEAASNLSNENYATKKKVLEAIADHADEFLLDTERYLAQIFGLDVEPLEIDWCETCTLISSVNSVDELEQCGSDLVKYFSEWKKKNYDGFEQDICGAIDNFKPGFAEARQKGKMLHMNKAEADKFNLQLYSILFFTTTHDALYRRACLHLDGEKAPEPTANQLLDTVVPIRVYLHVYRAFLHYSACKKPPQPNDFGDLECFIYVNDNRRVLTNDEKWITLAEEAHFSSKILALNADGTERIT